MAASGKGYGDIHMSRFTLDDYTSALQNLLPTGLVWPRKADGIQTAVLRALAQSYQQSDAAAVTLLTGAFPATATIMLTDLEKTFGLPDDCAIGENDSIAIRQKSVVSKLFSTGGQSAAYFIGVAKAMGYDITITFFRQARAGMSVLAMTGRLPGWLPRLLPLSPTLRLGNLMPAIPCVRGVISGLNAA